MKTSQAIEIAMDLIYQAWRASRNTENMKRYEEVYETLREQWEIILSQENRKGKRLQSK